MIYLDNAATTPVDEEVLAAMLPYYRERYGNPSGVYRLCAEARQAVEEARETIAGTIGCEPEEIYFTSGGTESDNWAICGAVHGTREKRGHIITTTTEHHGVLYPCRLLEEQGYVVSWLGVDETGRISLRRLEEAIREETFLMSIHYANNEIGTIQPIREIGKLAKRYGICFHTDAVQAYGHLPICVKEDNVTMLSASAHKFNGPKGIGFLYAKKGKAPAPLLLGGGQERGGRSGTENVAAIVGMAKAAKLAHEQMRERSVHVAMLRDYMIERLCHEIPYCRLNGSRSHRLDGNCNVSFQFVEGGALLILLDEAGICASSGSACSSRSEKQSHVLAALGVPECMARGTLRLTIGWQNTMEEMEYAVESIKKGVNRLRRYSGQYEDLVMERKNASPQ